MIRPRFAVLTGMIFAAAAARLIPHPPNFTPIAALALFGGAHFADKRLAFAVPLAALLLSDAALGFYPGMPAVYASFALVVVLGLGLRRRHAPRPIVGAALAGAALAGSVLFFLLTNFAVWLAGGLYPRTAAGLTECYIAAVPFFGHTVLGDLFFTAVLFGGFALAQKRWPVLERTSPALA